MEGQWRDNKGTMEEQLLTVREAAKRKGVTKGTIRRWIKQGKIRGKIVTEDNGQKQYFANAKDLEAVKPYAKPIDVFEIGLLYYSGLTQRQVAKKMRCSKSYIQNKLQEFYDIIKIKAELKEEEIQKKKGYPVRCDNCLWRKGKVCSFLRCVKKYGFYADKYLRRLA